MGPSSHRAFAFALVLVLVLVRRAQVELQSPEGELDLRLLATLRHAQPTSCCLLLVLRAAGRWLLAAGRWLASKPRKSQAAGSSTPPVFPPCPAAHCAWVAGGGLTRRIPRHVPGASAPRPRSLEAA